MKIVVAVMLLLLTLGCVSFVRAAVVFDWALVGNPGNPDDALTQLGGVANAFRISKHEVTNAQYAEFLNAVAANDPNALYAQGGTLTGWGGIVRSGLPGSYSYSIRADAVGKAPGGGDYSFANKPVNFVSFFDAMRFVNWLENGQPTGPQDASTTEDGVYAIGNGTNEVRNAGAKFFIPTEDEWYKAAYHKNDGVTGNYWDYPTSSDLPPDNNRPSADTGHSANYADVYNHADFNAYLALSYHMTDVGAYTLSASPYGTFDQAGNLSEWNERLGIGGTLRGGRGGSWSQDTTVYLHAVTASGLSANPNYEAEFHGFRVASIASIPEPQTGLLGALAAAGIVWRRTRQGCGRGWRVQFERPATPGRR